MSRNRACRPVKVRVLGIAALGAVIASSGGVEAEGDPRRGERQFQRCFACHAIDASDPGPTQGPSLHRVVGRRAAALPGYDYSAAMREKGAAGLVWDAATLDAYLADPEAVVPGTRMAVPPLTDAQARADLIAYLARGPR